MHRRLKIFKSGIVTLGWHVKYYLFNYSQGVITGIYTSSELPSNVPDSNCYQKDFDIEFKYFDMNIFNAYVWLGKDGTPSIVWVTEYEMKRREADRDERLAKHKDNEDA